MVDRLMGVTKLLRCVNMAYLGFLRDKTIACEYWTGGGRLARVAAVVCLFSLFLLSVESSLAMQTDPSSGPPMNSGAGEDKISIWEADAGDLNAPDGELGGLQTENASVQDPILVPLPAPVIAAASGLGLAWILRKRLARN